MTVAEFTKLDVVGMMFAIVDASQKGYMTNPQIMIEADKNVVARQYGDYTVVGFENKTKKTMMLFVKKA